MLSVDGRWVAFLAASVVLILIPGPSVLFAIGRALATGRRRALAAVTGNTLGIVLQVLAVAVGLGQVVERSALAFTVIKLVGATYLVILGVLTFRGRRRAAGALAEAAGTPGQPTEQPTGQPTAVAATLPRPLRCIADGIVVGGLNPKIIVFLVAFLPQFVDPSRPPTIQILTLGAVFAVIALACDSLWVLGAGTARAWFASSPRRLAALGGAGGVAMVGLGVGLATVSRPATS